MSLELIAVCKDTGAVDGATVCNNIVYQSASVLPPNAESNIELLLLGGFDPEVVKLGIIGVVSLWVVGLTVGLMASLVRKLLA